MAEEQIDSSSPVKLGCHLNHWFQHSPRRFLHYLSYYRFAGSAIGENKRILDVGCAEGIGTQLLSRNSRFTKGIDFDEAAVEVAKENWSQQSGNDTNTQISFECADLFKVIPEEYDAVVSFDLIEHILPENVSALHARFGEFLSDDGMLIIGTPNIETKKYASPITNRGHVNMYSGERLESELSEYFRHVFVFSANDEVVHTGFMPMAHYIIAVACGKK